MNTRLTNSWRWCAAVGLLAVGLARPGAAEERQFPAANCAITLPAGWHVLDNMRPTPGVLGGYADVDNTRVVVLVADTKNQSAGPMDDRFVKGFEQGFQTKAGGQRISGKFIEIAGLKAYERVGTIQVNGKPVSTLTRVVLADGTCYSVQGMCFTGDIREDAETLGTLESFRFLKPPTSGSGNPAFAIGYRVGYIGGRVVFFVGVAVGVTILIVSIVRRNRKPAPPPVPPGTL